MRDAARAASTCTRERKGSRMRSVARAGVAFVLVAVAAFATPAIAQAVVYVQEDELSLAPPAFLGPAGLAVNQSNGDLYVGRPLAPFQGGNSVERFDSTGTSLGTFASSLAAFGVTVPPSGGGAGNVYVLDAGLFDGTPDIQAFDSTGTQVLAPFGVDFDPTVIPQIGSGTPAGFLFYPNVVDDTVDLLTADGTFAGALDGGAAGPLVDPTDVAADNSFRAYVVDATGGGRVVKIDLLNMTAEVLAGTTGAMSVAVDPVTGDVFVGQGAGSAFHVLVYDSAGIQIGDFGSGDFAAENAFPRRIAVDSARDRVYVGDSSSDPATRPPRVVVYRKGAPPPVVTTMSASGASQTTATLAGTVAQSDVAPITGCRFEYTDEADFQANGFANAEQALCTAQYPSAAASLVLALGDVSGLEPNTTYRFRLVASNEDASGEGGDVVFQTLPNAPTVVTGAATDVQQTSATLGGTVNPNGGVVSACEIEYGTTTAYGQSKPCASAPGGGTSPTGVIASAADLAAGTTYHFRVRAANAGGAAEGSNQTFRTADRPDPCAANPESCKPTDQCVVTPASCKSPPVATRATLPGTGAVRAGRALVELSCRGAAGTTCKGRLRLRARIRRGGRKARTLTVGTARYELAAGKSTVLRVRLSRSARTALARKGRLRVRASGTGISGRSVLLRGGKRR